MAGADLAMAGAAITVGVMLATVTVMVGAMDMDMVTDGDGVIQDMVITHLIIRDIILHTTQATTKELLMEKDMPIIQVE
jgi:hypothetical protein